MWIKILALLKLIFVDTIVSYLVNILLVLTLVVGGFYALDWYVDRKIEAAKQAIVTKVVNVKTSIVDTTNATVDGIVDVKDDTATKLKESSDAVKAVYEKWTKQDSK